MIKTENLTKKFIRNETGFEAVNDVNMEVYDGEIVGVIGHSGSGKTTLFNMLAGLARQDSGTISVDGEDIASKSEKEMARYRNCTVGYILQGQNMLNNFTILDNVCMPAYLGDGQMPIREKAESLLKKVGLADMMNEYPRNLSGGELRRAAIVRALINDPEIIIADEPTNNLDTENSQIVMRMLRDISREGRTVLVSTHELSYLEYVDRVYEINEGKFSELDKSNSNAD